MLPNDGFRLTLLMHSVLSRGYASKRLDMRLREHLGLPSRSSRVERFNTLTASEKNQTYIYRGL